MDKEFISFPKYLCQKAPLEYMFTNIKLEDGDTFDYIPIDYRGLVAGEPTLTPQEVYKINRNNNYLSAPYDFAYAYAITTHKAQGSQWNKVMVFEEWFPNGAEEHARWLYTACTRASDRLLVIKK